MKRVLFTFVAAAMIFSIARCGDSSGSGAGSGPAGTAVGQSPSTAPTLVSIVSVESRAEFDLLNRGFDATNNCIRLFSDSSGNKYLEFRQGSCTSPGTLNFTLPVTTTDISLNSTVIGQYQPTTDGYGIFDLCTGTYKNLCQPNVQAGVLKCVAPGTTATCP